MSASSFNSVSFQPCRSHRHAFTSSSSSSSHCQRHALSLRRRRRPCSINRKAYGLGSDDDARSLLSEEDDDCTDNNTTPQVISCVERSIPFDLGTSFYRKESTFSRDLAVLAVLALKEQTTDLSLASHEDIAVLDAMAGAGLRGGRYLAHNAASQVWCNDANTDITSLVRKNLDGINKGKYTVTAEDVHHLLGVSLPSQSTTFDVVDVDSFGSKDGNVLLFNALRCLRIPQRSSDDDNNNNNNVLRGSLLYVTCTDGFAGSGRGPLRALSAYGCYTRLSPSCAETGLRMLAGAAIARANDLGLACRVVFTHYSPHGPVYRAMLHVSRRADYHRWRSRRDSEGAEGSSRSKTNQNMVDPSLGALDDYAFVGSCRACCGRLFQVPWSRLGHVTCPSCGSFGGGDGRHDAGVSVAGPLYVGPMHDLSVVRQMRGHSQMLGWDDERIAWSTKKPHGACSSLGELLERMEGEAHPLVGLGIFKVPDVTKTAGARTMPAIKRLLAALQDDGFVAERSHVDGTAFKTNASAEEVRSFVRMLEADA